MKKYFLIIFAAGMLASCNQQASTDTAPSVKNELIKVNYPETRQDESVVEDYHGTSVADPYRWLEDDNSEETASWVKAQNEVTFGYLDKIEYRDEIKKRYEELFNYPKLSSPFKAGDYYFFYKNDGLQNQSVIYKQKGLDGEPEVFLDPNAISEDGTASISLTGLSKDNKYMAYSRSDAGSDWTKIYVKEVATGNQLEDELEWVKFSGASWWKDGFFYSRYPAPSEGGELSADNINHSVYYHKLGDDQSKDRLIFADTDNPDYYHFGRVTEDKKYFILMQQPGTNGFSTFYKDLEKDSEFVKIAGGYNNKTSVVHSLGSKLLMITDVDAPNYRLVEVDLSNPSQENWKDIIPESENLLQGVNTGGGFLFANYLQNATDKFYKMNYDGTGKEEIKLPGTGSAGGFSGREGDDLLFYSYTSFTYPPTIFSYDVKTGESGQFFKTELKFNPKDYVEKQVFYESKDGTKVSMFVVHKKGLAMNGNNVTYLYGYGGFNVNLTPGFSASRIILLENGGVFAMPNLRGGGEYGEDWHKAGMLHNKQNVFDDFISAGEYLIKEGYTNSEKLAIAGGSNGGLLVGACMAQRPELFAVAMPAVGVMDMLRYHKFTVGKGWIPEYGNAEEPEHFKNLYSFSPLHNLKPGVEYPATMVTTADHDDRVVPAHSFKFASELQKAHKGDNPVLIRVAVDAGHGAGKPTSKIIEEQADFWSFIFYNTNTPVKYLKS